MVAEQWMSGTHILHDTVKDAHGNITKVGKYPSECVPELDEAVLKKTPGAFEAWKGLNDLPLKVCQAQGHKVVIASDKLAQFHHAPLNIIDAVQVLEEEHKQFEDLL